MPQPNLEEGLYPSVLRSQSPEESAPIADILGFMDGMALTECTRKISFSTVNFEP
jgi:hypothetical protein